jgi:hypothetical protein
MLDSDLAGFYEVETKELLRAVRRNLMRFPKDFAYQLTQQEFTILRRQFGTSSLSWGKESHSPAPIGIGNIKFRYAGRMK